MRHSTHIDSLLLSITKKKLPVRLFRRHVGLFIPASHLHSGLEFAPRVSIGIKGQADLTGFILFKDKPAIGVEVEVKSNASDKLRPEQIAWRDFCHKSNIPWYESRDIEATLEWLKKVHLLHC